MNLSENKPVSNKAFCIGTSLFLLLLCILPVICLVIGEQRNDKLTSGAYDAQFSDDLKSIAMPAIEKINLYHAVHGEYPKSIEELYPDGMPRRMEYLDGSLRYEPTASYYGTPFYFGFHGNYSGTASVHGWAILYCPVDVCKVDDFSYPSRRIDDFWIYVHSSAL